MDYKVVKLKCVVGQDDLDVILYPKEEIWVDVHTIDGQLDVNTTKEYLREFATNILKELDNDKENRQTYKGL